MTWTVWRAPATVGRLFLQDHAHALMRHVDGNDRVTALGARQTAHVGAAA